VILALVGAILGPAWALAVYALNVLVAGGAGRVLTGIARRFDGIEARSVGTPEELETAAAALVS
jgi:hypothetical protein